MSLLKIDPEFAGQVGVNPRLVRITSTDNYATVIAAGYLNPANLMGYTINPTDFIFMAYNNGTDFGVFNPSISSGVITLVPYNSQNIVAARSGTFAGGGTTFNISVSGVTASSVAVANIHASTNSVSINKVTCSTNQIAITFSADPGASTTVNYIVYLAGT